MTLRILLLGAILAFIGLPTYANTLPYCGKPVCIMVEQNKLLGKVTTIVWNDKDSVISSSTIDLPRDAKLVVGDRHFALDDISAVSTKNTTSSTQDPPPPPAGGSGGVVRVFVYETATHYISQPVVFIYHEGVLIDVHFGEPKRTKKPTGTFIEE